MSMLNMLRSPTATATATEQSKSEKKSKKKKTKTKKNKNHNNIEGQVGEEEVTEENSGGFVFGGGFGGFGFGLGSVGGAPSDAGGLTPATAGGGAGAGLLEGMLATAASHTSPQQQNTTTTPSNSNFALATAASASASASASSPHAAMGLGGMGMGVYDAKHFMSFGKQQQQSKQPTAPDGPTAAASQAQQKQQSPNDNLPQYSSAPLPLRKRQSSTKHEIPTLQKLLSSRQSQQQQQQQQQQSGTPPETHNNNNNAQTQQQTQILLQQQSLQQQQHQQQQQQYPAGNKSSSSSSLPASASASSLLSMSSLPHVPSSKGSSPKLGGGNGNFGGVNGNVGGNAAANFTAPGAMARPAFGIPLAAHHSGDSAAVNAVVNTMMTNAMAMQLKYHEQMQEVLNSLTDKIKHDNENKQQQQKVAAAVSSSSSQQKSDEPPPPPPPAYPAEADRIHADPSPRFQSPPPPASAPPPPMIADLSSYTPGSTMAATVSTALPAATSIVSATGGDSALPPPHPLAVAVPSAAPTTTLAVSAPEFVPTNKANSNTAPEGLSRSQSLNQMLGMSHQVGAGGGGTTTPLTQSNLAMMNSMTSNNAANNNQNAIHQHQMQLQQTLSLQSQSAAPLQQRSAPQGLLSQSNSLQQQQQQYRQAMMMPPGGGGSFGGTLSNRPSANTNMNMNMSAGGTTLNAFGSTHSHSNQYSQQQYPQPTMPFVPGGGGVFGMGHHGLNTNAAAAAALNNFQSQLFSTAAAPQPQDEGGDLDAIQRQRSGASVANSAGPTHQEKEGASAPAATASATPAAGKKPNSLKTCNYCQEEYSGFVDVHLAACPQAPPMPAELSNTLGLIRTVQENIQHEQHESDSQKQQEKQQTLSPVHSSASGHSDNDPTSSDNDPTSSALLVEKQKQDSAKRKKKEVDQFVRLDLALLPDKSYTSERSTKAGGEWVELCLGQLPFSLAAQRLTALLIHLHPRAEVLRCAFQKAARGRRSGLCFVVLYDNGVAQELVSAMNKRVWFEDGGGASCKWRRTVRRSRPCRS